MLTSIIVVVFFAILYVHLGNTIFVFAGLLFVVWLGWWSVAILGALVLGFLIWLWMSEVAKVPCVTSSFSGRYDPRSSSRRDYELERTQIPEQISDGSYELQMRRNSALAKSFTPSPISRTKSSLVNDSRPIEVGLIIRNEHLEKILSGRKTWEMRTKGTNKRETIALIKKGSGQVFGVADIVQSLGPLSDRDLRESIHQHGIEESRLGTLAVAKYRHAWVLANVRRLNAPVPYVHPKGAQQFVRLQSAEIQAIASQVA
jgi:hypothetical protein